MFDIKPAIAIIGTACLEAELEHQHGQQHDRRAGADDAAQGSRKQPDDQNERVAGHPPSPGRAALTLAPRPLDHPLSCEFAPEVELNDSSLSLEPAKPGDCAIFARHRTTGRQGNHDRRVMFPERGI
ncbi:MAG TPA: hypothetical protein VJ747_14205 [Stellaceae bacterium]|nr:hypothetical protein [Stellaceae bacterium]